jgi:hypothetical protein
VSVCPFVHLKQKSAACCLSAAVSKNNLPQKEFASPLLWHASLHPFTLQAYDKTIAHSLQPFLDQELANRLTLLKITRLNI